MHTSFTVRLHHFSFAKKVSLPVIAILIFSLSSFGQRGFYIKDTVMFNGVKMVDGGKIENAKWCVVKKGDSIFRYSPSEVLKYGFNGGQTYISKVIPYSGTTKQVFLEQLATGKITLFYFAERNKSTFFIEKDSSSFFELPKGTRRNNSFYQNQLQEFAKNSPGLSDNAKLVSYNKKSLTRFVNDYNSQINKPFPFLRFGITGIYEMTKLKSSTDLNYDYLNFINFFYESSFAAGIFLDAPLSASDYSYHTELLYSKHGYSYLTNTENKDIDFIANITSLKMPVLFRYTLPTNKIRPFANAGGILAYNIKNENALYATTISETMIETDGIEINTMISDFNAGFSAGVGLEFKINYRRSLFFEMRYNQYFTGKTSNTLNSSDVQFITSINL